MSEQAQHQKKMDGHRRNSATEKSDDLPVAKSFHGRRFHRALEKKLTRHKRDQRSRDEEKYKPAHSFSSNLATGFAVSIKPTTTSAIPHQRRGEMCSPSINQQLSGTKISTTRESGNAIDSGMYLKT